jgi:tRNA/tmRNA/rRNA uracil-C5-methylase (TrmA/RlmC/RlmD family)
MRPPPATIDLTITALDHDGRGIAPSPDGVGLVRVPFALPGERARARVWRRGPAAADADLVEILAPAAERVPATCPLFGVCGGCQLQHLPYGKQLDWKTSVVRDLFAPLGLAATVATCIGSPRELGYRSKITPHHERPRPGQPVAIGFLKVGRRHDVVDVAHCPLATDAVNARLPALRAEAGAVAASRRRGVSLLIREATSGVTTDPDARVIERIAGLELGFFAREFFQNNPFLLPHLLTFVLDAAVSGGASTLVDAYAGSGLFALAAASRFKDVIGVEVSAGAVVAAKENTARNRITNVRFIAANAARIFEGLAPSGAETAVILDPPRKGCDEDFMAQLLAFGPRTVVYVSCNPATQTRDVGLLLGAGYRVRLIQPFDMFPQTQQLECVAVLDRSQ